MFVSLALLGSVLTFQPNNSAQFLRWYDTDITNEELPHSNQAPYYYDNYGVKSYCLMFNRTNDSHPNNNQEISVKLGSFVLTDSSNGSTYENYLSVYFNYLETTNYTYEWSINLVQYDFDTPFGTYPYLNYQVYTGVDYWIPGFQNTQHGYGDQIITLFYGTNEIYFVGNEHRDILSSGSDIYFYVNFLYLSENIYRALESDMSVGEYSDGYKLGYNNGKQDGIQQGVTDYKNSQEYQDELQNQYDLGEQVGISEGRAEVIEQGQTATVIFNGIISVGLLPVNVFLKMLNLEVFGINIGALVSSLLTICVIIIIARMIFGKNGE